MAKNGFGNYNVKIDGDDSLFSISGSNVLKNGQQIGSIDGAGNVTSPNSTSKYEVINGLVFNEGNQIGKVTGNSSVYGKTGLIDSVLNQNGVASMPSAPKMATGKASTWDAKIRQVNDNDLTSTNLNKLLDSNSGYMKRAGTRGTQYANSRGLVNSSMGAEAAQAAAIDAAAPIANADASTYFTQGTRNQDAENSSRSENARMGTEVSMFNAGETNKGSLAGFDTASRGALQRNDGIIQSLLNEQSHDFNMAEQGARFGHDENMQDRGFTHDTNMQERGFTHDATMQDDRQAYDQASQGRTFEHDNNMQDDRQTFEGGQQADRIASDRDIEATRLQASNFDTLLDGIANINMQDMDATEKAAAIKVLNDNWLAGSPIYSALQNSKIENGEVIDTTPAPTEASDTAGAGGASTDQQQPGQPQQNVNDPYSYQSIESMPVMVQDWYTEKHGDVSPPDLVRIQGVVDYANLERKFGDYIKENGTIISRITGAKFDNYQVAKQYNDFVREEFKNGDMDFTDAEIFKAMTGGVATNPVEPKDADERWRAPYRYV